MSRILHPRPVSFHPCPRLDPAQAEDYRRDESRLTAPTAPVVYMPATIEEAAGAIREAGDLGWRLAIAGARTGIAGGAVPMEAEAVLSLAALRGMEGPFRDGAGAYIRVGPGATLRELHDRLKASPPPRYWFPPDPTETSASFGGLAATSASGARSFRYGSVRPWIRAVEALLADGRRLRLRRGEVAARDGGFVLKGAGGKPDREVILPHFPMPRCKRSLGYPMARDLDAVDLFIGQEGTLGVITELELALAPAPAGVLGVLCGVPNEAAALHICQAARESFMTGLAAAGECPRALAPGGGTTPSAAVLSAIEYFCPASLELLQKRRAEDPSCPVLPNTGTGRGEAAIFLEFIAEAHSREEEDGGDASPRGDLAEAILFEAAERLHGWLEDVRARPDDAWAATTSAERARQAAFRHAVPETVNAWIAERARMCPGLHKVGTDMAVPDHRLADVMALYRQGLADTGLEAVLFGHLGDNHVHVNILPRTLGELSRAKELTAAWAGQVAAWGGAVAAEHGLGRLKKPLLPLQFPESVLDGWRRLRRAFDPGGLLAPGVLA